MDLSQRLRAFALDAHRRWDTPADVYWKSRILVPFAPTAPPIRQTDAGGNVFWVDPEHNLVVLRFAQAAIDGALEREAGGAPP